MNPRLKTSVKWTALPSELCDQIRAVFKETFAAETKNGDVHVEGRIYPTELLLRIGYLEKGRLRQANFEVSLDINPQKQNALELIHFAVDCAGSMMSNYFEAEEDLEDFPREWESHTFDGKKAFLQVTTNNTGLDAEADRLLGQLKDDLVQGDTESSEEDAVITMLGLDQEGDFPDEETADDESAEEEASEEDADDADDGEDGDDDDNSDTKPSRSAQKSKRKKSLH